VDSAKSIDHHERPILQIVKNSTGAEYKYCVLVSGAQMGVAAGLKALEKNFGEWVFHDDLYFLRYPQMIKTLGLTRMNRQWFDHDGGILLTASPSNPTGEIDKEFVYKPESTIWDAAYHNEIYTSPVASAYLPRPNHSMMVGSLGKLTGINGLRLGWVATNDALLAEEVKVQHYNLTLGVSTTSLGILENLLNKVNLTDFFINANHALNDNRSELSKLEYLFARPVPKYGMFWFTEADSAVRKLLEKAKVTYVEGKECGGSADTLRITMGQTRSLTKDMVKAVLKGDKK
jgi:aspartate/methionine/tyrosine aminotransferase